jgi:predicted TIM-barrel fold metal-dependent hydrolase
LVRARPTLKAPATFAGPKIDAHAHIGDFGSWANVACDESELLGSMRLNNVARSCVFYWDNELVRRAVAAHPRRLVGAVWPDPRREDSPKLVRTALKEWKFRAVKLHPLIHAFLPDDDVVHPIMEEARRARAPVLIHSGHPPFSLPWSIGELAERFPDVKIVMLHMGHGHGVYIQAALRVAKRLDNVYLETSGMPMHSKIKEAVDTVGEERVMYGSDIPFHDPAVEIARVCASRLPEEALERVFNSNSKTLLGL